MPRNYHLLDRGPGRGHCDLVFVREGRRCVGVQSRPLFIWHLVHFGQHFCSFFTQRRGMGTSCRVGYRRSRFSEVCSLLASPDPQVLLPSPPLIADISCMEGTAWVWKVGFRNGWPPLSMGVGLIVQLCWFFAQTTSAVHMAVHPKLQSRAILP